MTTRNSRRWVRGRSGLLFLLVTVAAAVVVWVSDAAPAIKGPGTPSVAASLATPPALICGDASILNGPSEPPAGAVAIYPGQNLTDATIAHPEGTTFWLAPGTHTLLPTEFAQVIPKNGNSYIGAPGAVLDGQGVNRYAFTQKAAGVTVKYLTVQHFVAPGNEGVVNHDAGPAWIIERNTVRFNGGAGAFLGDDNRLTYNCLADNSQYGFQGAGVNMVVDHNEVARNNTLDYETNNPGCGCSGGAKFWDSGPALITNNYVHDNFNVGLWVDTNNFGFLFEGNYISDNRSHGILYETSYNARIVRNTFLRNAIPQGREFQSRGDSFPVGAIYISESGGDSRVAGGVYATLEIAANVFDNNWAGVVLWENADRYCGSNANTSTGYCTLGGSASLATCVAGTIQNPPFYSDCRWKTQNVLVSDNDFRVDKAAIGCTTNYCATQAVFSNVGTYPSWSPYKGRVIQNAITFTQNNRFTKNRYVGDWTFTAYETGRVLAFSQWSAAPYSQDADGSWNATPTSIPTPTTVATTATPSTTLAPSTTSTTIPVATSESLWPDSFVPDERNNGLEYTLGTRFVSTVGGEVVALRFYQTLHMSGPVGLKLWKVTNAAAGVEAASVTVSIVPGGVGWRTAKLPVPVRISPNEQYIVSYHVPVYFPFAWDYFRGPRISGSLIGLADNTPSSYRNGVYKEEYGSHTFPTRSDGHSYFADVVFRRA